MLISARLRFAGREISSRYEEFLFVENDIYRRRVKELRSAMVGACQSQDFDVFDAATMQQTRNLADRRTGSDGVINNGNMAVVTP